MVNARQLKHLIIAAVALHSLILGTTMLVCPLWALDLAGWEYEGSTFFPAQAGLFLLILAGAYLTGIWVEPFAWFLVASKAAAVVFLVAEYMFNNGPVMLLPAAFFDGLMGIAVAVAVVVTRHSREGGNPRSEDSPVLDSRLRGNDEAAGKACCSPVSGERHAGPAAQ